MQKKKRGRASRHASREKKRGMCFTRVCAAKGKPRVEFLMPAWMLINATRIRQTDRKYYLIVLYTSEEKNFFPTRNVCQLFENVDGKFFPLTSYSDFYSFLKIHIFSLHVETFRGNLTAFSESFTIRKKRTFIIFSPHNENLSDQHSSVL